MFYKKIKFLILYLFIISMLILGISRVNSNNYQIINDGKEYVFFLRPSDEKTEIFIIGDTFYIKNEKINNIINSIFK